MKVKRHNKIREIVENFNIETQEELITHLRDCGFDVTQATVSRDIRELKLVKAMNESGFYKYVAPSVGVGNNSHVYNTAIAGSIKTVACAGHNVVIKTYPGMAQAVAAGIDGFSNDLTEGNILGCVAGDDTIIVVVSDVESTKKITDKIRELLG